MIKKINNNWRAVFKRYSFITHLAIAVSSVLLLAIQPFMDYLPIELALTITGVLALIGIIGSFIKQEIKEDD
jgi:hypothetical protein